MTTFVSLQIKNGVGVIKLQNPPLNLVTVALLQELDEILTRARTSSDIAALVLTGEGNRAFCAGSDLNQTLALKEAGQFLEEKLAYETDVFCKIASFPKPVIAAVEGVAFGGGLELASCCDLIFASSASRFALPEINIAGFPPTGIVRVSRLIGLSRLKQLVLTGEPIDADTALSWGLCSGLAAPGEVLGLAMQNAERFNTLPKRALQMTKRAIQTVNDADSEVLLRKILSLSDLLSKSGDGLAGAQAFLSKKPANFEDQILDT